MSRTSEPPPSAEFSDPDVSAKKAPPANAFTRGATSSPPALSATSEIAGISCGLRYSRWCDVSYTWWVIDKPASSRILFVNGFVHDTCCSRFGLVATDHHDSGEVNVETTPPHGS